jgi:amino acid adenylation domain-containing protein
MGHFIISTVWTEGDVIPFLRLGSGLRARGHEVTLVTHAHFGERARALGLDFEPIDAMEDYPALVADNPLFNTPQGFLTVYRRHVLPKLQREYEAIVNRYRPGSVLVIRSTPSIGARMAAERLNTSFVPVFLAPSFVTTLPQVHSLLGSVLANEIDAVRAGVSLPPVRDWNAWLATPPHGLGLWPEWFAPLAGDAPRGIALAGFLCNRDTPRALPPADAAEGPLLVTGGTGLYMGAEYFAFIAEACRRLGRKAIFVSQHREVLPKELPAEVTWVRRIEFAEAMPRAAAVVHHGGIGTLGEAMASGAPQLVMGTGADRPDNAAHLVRIGVADFLPPPRWSAENVADALTRLIGDAALRARCRAFAERVAANDATATACAFLESLTMTPLYTAASAAPALRESAPKEAARALPDLSKLSPAKRALLERQLSKQLSQKKPAETAIVPSRRADQKEFVASFGQERLWFLEKLTPGDLAYTVHAAVRVRGALDLDALADALRVLVARHEALRTTIVTIDERPSQWVAPSSESRLEREHVSRDAVLAAAQAEVHRPFDLEQGPLVRAKALIVGADEHVLVFTMHHIISDGWSLGVLIRELGALYAAGRNATLPPLAIQYADFVEWQRGWLEGGELQRQLAFWKNRLAGVPRTLDLPSDRPRPASRGTRGARYAVQIDAELTRRLRDRSAAAGTTLYMTLLAGFGALLSRLSGQARLAIGTPIANRTRRETEGLIGFFANTLVLDVAVTPGIRVGELLAQVKATALEAYAHQDAPFERIVQELDPVRDLSRTPVFQVMFSLQNATNETLRLGEATLEEFPIPTDAAKFDLSLDVRETGDVLLAEFEYATDLFDADRIARSARQFERLLRGMEPNELVADLPLLDGEERARVLAAASGATIARPKVTVVDLFERQAAGTPDAVALTYEGESLSYAELDARANHLAHHLRAHGVSAESRVGLSMARSIDLVVALLGILKAGAAYVPLDADYPVERIDFMRKDARLELVLNSVARGAGAPLTMPRAGASLAYVIYTSGSTGLPKGAMNSHEALLNRLLWMQEAYPIGPGDAVLQKTPFSFDVSVWEFFWPLITGARLVVAQPGGHQDPAYLANLIDREAITTVHFVPSMLRAFLEHDGGPLPSLKRVICSGEALTPDLETRFFQRFAAELHNLYGPTEAAIDVTAWACPRSGSGASVPIGAPIANTQAIVLDENLAPLPIGVPGELFLGGVQLARGYWDRPGLTAERFIPHPFARGERLYRTGDRAALRADGAIEYLGRLDHQVKLRGFRIELGEIEARLTEQPGVRDAAVVMRDERLVAYVVGEAKGLRDALLRTLPEYMVPGVFVTLDVLPLGPTGKIDRKALPAPAAPMIRHDRVAPRTAEEAALVAIWKDVLRVPEVGIHDSFFELGGHSLLATRVMGRIRQSLQRELPLRAFFEEPTVAGLARRLHGTTADVPLVPVARDGSDLPLSFGQERLWFLSELDPTSTAYHIASVVRLKGELRIDLLERAFQHVIERHESLRTAFVASGGKPAQRVHAHVPFTLATSEEGLHAPFDLGRPPLLRAALRPEAANEHVLSLTMHHIVSDGWSMSVLVEELAALYDALARGVSPALPALPIQYPDYAVWQRAWLSAGELERQLAYWVETLRGAPPLELPADRPRPPVQTSRGARVAFRFSEALTARIRSLAGENSASLYMTLLAGFNVLVGRYVRQRDVVIGTPIANRARAETESLIGFFVNTLALRTLVDEQRSYRTLLAQVKTTTLDAFAHQDLPFEKLVDALKPARDLSRTPIFQILFVLQNAPTANLVTPELTIAPEAPREITAQFDLTCAFVEDGAALAGTFDFNVDLFDTRTVERLARHLERLFDALTRAPDAPLHTLDFVDDSERMALLSSGTGPTVARSPQTVVDAFEAQVALRPDAVAVTFEGTSLTYAELNARANQWAHHLVGRGIGREALVGVSLPRSLDLVVALWAVLKAGAAYVPFDPDYPRERLDFMRRDANVAFMLDAPPIDAVAQEPATNPRVVRDPRSLAYVIYTSGSTGQPKGAMNSHAGLLNRLLWMQETYPLDASDVVLQKTPFSFDVSLWEFFWAHMVGARLAVARPDGHKDPLYLAATIRRERVTTLHFVPSMLAAFLEYDSALPALRRVICSGEALSADLEKRFYRLSGAELHNLYGPTEASIDVTAWSCPRGGSGGSVPIGRPIANTQALVLDDRFLPAPVGVPGELCLGGVQLARGYLGRPALTAEKFVPHPFAESERLYRTGDLARLRDDGAIEYLGRLDHQVKLRGFRIELGEIEARLAPLVKDCVVIVREDIPGDKRLVAYVVGGESAAALRDALAAALPDYMVPSAFVFLDALPLSPNGKLERRALPAPEVTSANAYVPPQTECEETLVNLFVTILRVPRAGIHDSFFALGGHSLTATQLVSGVRERLGVEIPVRALFEAPTAAKLAEVIERTRKAPPVAPAGPIVSDRSAAKRELENLDQLSEAELDALLASSGESEPT